jgi:hypothetical protein
MCRGALPLDRAGTFALPKLAERSLVSQYLEHHHISEDLLKEHFTVMLQQFLQGVIKQDLKSVEKLAEPRFFKKLQEKNEEFKKFNLKYQPTSVEQATKTSYIIDQMLIKGVKANRDDNDCNHDYMYVDTNESEGLRYYLHKYFLGFHPYYIEIKNEEFFNKMKKNDTPIEKIP